MIYVKWQPTVERYEGHVYLDNWSQALDSDFKGLSYGFETGHSKWSFFLSQVDGSLSVHLQLLSDGYSKGALFAGFTVFLLNSEGIAVRNSKSHNLRPPPNKILTSGGGGFWICPLALD